MPIYLDNKEIGFLTQPKIGYGGEYEGKSIIHEDGTQTLKLTTVTEPKTQVSPRSEPETWKRIRETLHTNPNDQFFLIGSGASDTFALKTGGTGYTISVYGGTDGTTLLFTDSLNNNTLWSLYSRDLENYPLPKGLTFSDLKGCYYKDDVVGECELFAIVAHHPNDAKPSECYTNIPIPSSRGQEFYYNVLEYAGNTVPDRLLYGSGNNVSCYNCEFVFLGESVTTLGFSCFAGCHNLHTINIPESVTQISNSAFSTCYSLANITLPSGLTNIGTSAFSACYSLANITLPSRLTSIGSSAFSNCYALQSIIIPEGVTTINSKTFSYCQNLKKLILPSTLQRIQDEVMYHCHCLQTIDIPESVTEIGRACFNANYSLKSIKLPNNITVIDQNTFNSCYSVQSIIIPDSVTNIGDYAFYYCDSLKKLESNCIATASSLNLSGCANLEYVKMPYLQAKLLNIYGTTPRPLTIGSFGEIEGSESPTLGLTTPIFIDYTNSIFDGSSIPIKLNYTCLTLDHLKSIFDWLPVTTTTKSIQCGNLRKMNLTTGVLETSTAFDDFLAWYNTLPDADPGDGTIWKKGWSVIS